MRIPVVVGWSDKLRRTGAIFHAACPRCMRLARMHEAVKLSNVSAFAVISLWDEEERAVQCGECLAIFAGDASDEIRARAEAPPSLLQTIVAALPTWLASRKPAASPPAAGLELAAPQATPAARPLPAPSKRRVDEAAVDAELAALKKRLGKSAG